MREVEIAKELIAFDSVTSKSNYEIARRMESMLGEIDFEIETIEYRDNAGLAKLALVGRRGPASTTTAPGIAYCCHNDVVAVEGWNAPHGGPFEPIVADQRLWGRGSCDMKGSAAAAMAAIERIDVQTQLAPIYFIVTGDEESGMQGAMTVVQRSKLFHEMMATNTVGVIGEPTELQVVNSHKGGCHILVESLGVAAHSSTSQGKNANWSLVPFLAHLNEQYSRTHTDPGLLNHQFDPPTLSMNIVIKNEPAASNITVGKATCQIFIRPMPQTQWQSFIDDLLQQATNMGLNARRIIQLDPLHTPADHPFVVKALELVQQDVPISVCYATDGCGLKALPNLLVLGPGSIEQAHRPDEWIALEQLSRGVEVYEQLFRLYSL